MENCELASAGHHDSGAAAAESFRHKGGKASKWRACGLNRCQRNTSLFWDLPTTAEVSPFWHVFCAILVAEFLRSIPFAKRKRRWSAANTHLHVI
jgi:hypothetical protein